MESKNRGERRRIYRGKIANCSSCNAKKKRPRDSFSQLHAQLATMRDGWNRAHCACVILR